MKYTESDLRRGISGGLSVGFSPSYDPTNTEAEILAIKAVVDKYHTPKQHISKLAESKEDCKAIAALACNAGWAFSNCFRASDHTVIEITAHPMKFMHLRIYDHGGFVFSNTYTNHPIPNCLQICTIISSKYTLEI
jgi:hypothetical protein